MQWFLNFYNSIGEVSSFRDFSLQILICKINYNKSEQILCIYFIYYFFTLTYAILLIRYANMIMEDHALFINHCMFFVSCFPVDCPYAHVWKKIMFMRFMSDAAILHLHFPHGNKSPYSARMLHMCFHLEDVIFRACAKRYKIIPSWC